jgi:hypothetical protein
VSIDLALTLENAETDLVELIPVENEVFFSVPPLLLIE